MTRTRCLCGVLGWTVAAWLAVCGTARATELWVAPTYQQDLGGLGVASNTIWPVTAIGAVRFVWAIPNDLQTFQSAKVVLIPSSPAGAANVNIVACAAQNGNVVTSSCAGPTAEAYTGVANQLVEVEVGMLITPHIGTPGANYLAVVAFTTPTTTTDHIVGLRFTYVPKTPAGVPTLAANTFTGTQTAPAFAGDGSGLTNLPVPAGAATLGTNTFTGTQTAPAFVGSGAGLSNLPFPSGAARLFGGNLFSGDQSVSGSLAVTNNSTFLPLQIQSGHAFGTWLELANTSPGGQTWAILSAGGQNSEGAGNLGITNFHGGTVEVDGPLQINGDWPMSGAAHMNFSGFFMGSLCATVIECGGGSGGAWGAFVPDRDIIITHMTVTINSQINVTCLPGYAVVSNASSIFVQVPLPASSSFVDSGALAVSVPAGTQLFLGAYLVSPANCHFATSAGGDLFFNVQYVMK